MGFQVISNIFCGFSFKRDRPTDRAIGIASFTQENILINWCLTITPKMNKSISFHNINVFFVFFISGLGLYLFFLIIIAGAEIAAGVLGFIHKTNIEDKIAVTLEDKWEQYYSGKNTSVTVITAIKAVESGVSEYAIVYFFDDTFNNDFVHPSVCFLVCPSGRVPSSVLLSIRLSDHLFVHLFVYPAVHYADCIPGLC